MYTFLALIFYLIYPEIDLSWFFNNVLYLLIVQVIVH